jgi:hypothetical protein
MSTARLLCVTRQSAPSGLDDADLTAQVTVRADTVIHLRPTPSSGDVRLIVILESLSVSIREWLVVSLRRWVPVSLDPGEPWRIKGGSAATVNATDDWQPFR